MPAGVRAYMPSYRKTLLRDVVTIRRIVSIHYFEYARGYAYEGESHDFWEFLYVDKGEVNVRADRTLHCLTEGDIIFHKPDEFHTVEANGRIAPNLIVCAFECVSDAMRSFEGRILRLGSAERDTLAKLVKESRLAFSTPLHTTDAFCLERRADAPAGAEQLVGHCLEELLIRLLRRMQAAAAAQEIPAAAESLPSTSVRDAADQQVLQAAIRYMEAHADRHVTFSEVAGHVLMGESALKALFRNRMGCGVVACATRIRIDAAKRMIRESGLHFSDIAERMGWSSVHHFSRQFKKMTGMTPSQYARSALGRS